MGYSFQKKDLYKFDNNKRILKTGDIAKKDKDNFYYIVGRKDRYTKIFGNRVNLFEIEEVINKIGIKAVCLNKIPNRIDIYSRSNNNINFKIMNLLKDYTDLHPNCFNINNVKKLPLNLNFKIKYNLNSND